MKHTGEYPLVGVNTFINEDAEEPPEPELTRATAEERDAHLAHLHDFHKRHAKESGEALASVQQVARDGGNIFEELLRTVRSCSLRQISSALYDFGGQYRRSMSSGERSEPLQFVRRIAIDHNPYTIDHRL